MLSNTSEDREDCGYGKRQRSVAPKLGGVRDLTPDIANVDERLIEVGHGFTL